MVTKLQEKRLGSIYLREIEDGDYLDYFEIGKDSETCKYVNWGPFKKPYEALYAIQEIFDKRPLIDELPKGYAIILDNHMIGMIDYHSENKKFNSIEIGYFLKREYWGRGIMRKCVSYMVNLAFSLGFSKVVLGSFKDNLRSIRLIESLGFHYEYQVVDDLGDGKLYLARYYAKYENEE